MPCVGMNSRAASISMNCCSRKEPDTWKEATKEYRHIPVLLSECLEQSRIKTLPYLRRCNARRRRAFFRGRPPFGRRWHPHRNRPRRNGFGRSRRRLRSLALNRAAAHRASARQFRQSRRIAARCKIPGSMYSCSTWASRLPSSISIPRVLVQRRRAAGYEDGSGQPDGYRRRAHQHARCGRNTRIIRDYSDEKWASRIAQFIVAAREHAPIETSGQLVEIIKAAIPASARRAGGHPPSRTFQACASK